MERSDPVTHILARIMMRMDRYGENRLDNDSVSATGEPAPLPREAYRRRRTAQPGRDPTWRKPPVLEPTSFAPMAHDDSPSARNKGYGLER